MTVKTQYFTGLRPTGDLTLGNYLGAVKPIIDLQKKAEQISFFVADLHGLTDQEPDVVASNINHLITDLLAFGVDTNKTSIFIQSHIKEQVLYLSMLLSRHISLAELMRVPALKDKLKNPDNPEKASAMLAYYPVMMASDILLQGSQIVPVGEDQISHIEVTRLLAKRFNTKYSDIFTLPKPQEMKPLRILSLTGESKMSKSSPSGAILINDPIDVTIKKIKRAETAVEGEMSPVLESHFEIIKQLGTSEQITKLKGIKARHLSGDKVMGEFKELLIEVVEAFIVNYQSNKQQILNDPAYVEEIVKKGNDLASSKADEVIQSANKAMGLSQ